MKLTNRRWPRSAFSMSSLPLPQSAAALVIIIVTTITFLSSSVFTNAQEMTEQAYSSTAKKSFKIYHSLGQNKPFLPRGTITLSTNDNGGGVTTTIENDQNCLGPNALQDMDELVSEDGFYRIKIVDEQEAASSKSVNGGTKRSILASVPGCEVRRANFREQIELSLSQTGSLLSMSYKPLVSPLAAQCEELSPLSSNDSEYAFQTLISYSTSTPGMTLPKILPKMRPPPGLNVIKLKRNPQSASPSSNVNSNKNQKQNPGLYSEEEEEKKKQQENQSFFRKYWYIIVPTVIMLLLGGEEPPPPQQQQKQRQVGGAAAPAGGSGVPMPSNGLRGGGASSSGGSGAVRQRRGKRG